MYVKLDQPISKQREAGFTILELLVATAIFSITMLVLAVGVLQFTNSYFKGITASTTQTTTRSIMSDIAQSIQLGKTITNIPVGLGTVSGLCIDNTLYSYQPGQQVIDTAPNPALHQAYHGLVVSTGAACASGVTPTLPATSGLPANSRELLGQHMRVSALDVTQNGNLYTIHVRIIYGDDDLLLPVVSAGTVWANESCAGQSGSQFCAVSDLTTTVEQRLL